MLQVNTILVPTDFSESADAAIDYAISLAKSFDAGIHLLHCLHINPTVVTPYGVTLPPSVDDELRAAAELRLTAAREKVAAQGVPAMSELSLEDPPHAIVERAAAVEADLIVMGTRGLSGIKHVLLGSTAERTLRNAPCPVVTVRDGAEA